MTAFAQTALLGAAPLTSILPGGVNDPKWLDNPALTKQFVPAIIDTLLMMGFATLFTVLIGLPLGLLLVQTGRTASRRIGPSTRRRPRSSTSSAPSPSSSASSSSSP